MINKRNVYIDYESLRQAPSQTSSVRIMLARNEQSAPRSVERSLAGSALNSGKSAVGVPDTKMYASSGWADKTVPVGASVASVVKKSSVYDLTAKRPAVDRSVISAGLLKEDDSVEAMPGRVAPGSAVCSEVAPSDTALSGAASGEAVSGEVSSDETAPDDTAQGVPTSEPSAPVSIPAEQTSETSAASASTGDFSKPKGPVPLIEFKNVSFSYDKVGSVVDGKITPVLNNVSFSIGKGEFVSVVGANGSGKSTLARLASALLVPDKGTVKVAGLDSRDPKNTFPIRSMVGMVFQNPTEQMVATLVENEVAFGPENLGVSFVEIRRRVDDVLKQVGLSGFEQTEVYTLSGGQAHRTTIAGVLAMHPQLLVFDEASSMLDPQGRLGLLKLIKVLNKKGFSVLMITHIMEEAACADRMIVLRRGSIMLEGTPRNVLAREMLLKRANLNVPYIFRLSSILHGVNRSVGPCITPDELAHSLREACSPSVSLLWEHTGASRSSGSSDAETVIDANNSSADAASKEGGFENEAKAFLDEINKDEAIDFEDEQRESEVNTPEEEAVVLPKGSRNAQAFIDCEEVYYTYAKKRKRQLVKEKRAVEAQQARQGQVLPAQVQKSRKRKIKKPKWGRSAEDMWACKNVSCSIEKSSFVGIVGHTGSGKTTFVQLLNGFLRPTFGDIRVNGVHTSDKREARKLCGKVGLLGQYPERQLFAETVLEDVTFGPLNQGVSKEKAEDLAIEALRSVGLNPYTIQTKSPFALSGGVQRLVAFAGILAMQPNVLIVDEPCAGLDPVHHRIILELLRKLNKTGITIIMVTHDMDDVVRYADTVLVFNEGSLYMNGTPEEVFVHQNHLEKIGLSGTQVGYLVRRLVENGVLPKDYSSYFFAEDELAYLLMRVLANDTQVH